MILTKRQIIDMEIKKSFKDSKVPQKLINMLMRRPELSFLETAKKELNFNLDPIRKNLYIVK